MKKRNMILLLFMLMAMVLAGCSGNDAASGNSAAASSGTKTDRKMSLKALPQVYQRMPDRPQRDLLIKQEAAGQRSRIRTVFQLMIRTAFQLMIRQLQSKRTARYTYFI